MWENLGRTVRESDRIALEPVSDFDEAARGAKSFIACGLHFERQTPARPLAALLRL
jgi:hypothetical protein